MKYKELATMPAGELQHTLAETRSKLRELRFKTANSQLKNVREIRTSKKTAARVLTVLNLNKKK